MQRRFSVVFINLIFMAMFTSTAFAAPAQISKGVTLYSVEYQQGGMILFFHTAGLTKDDLKNNSFYAHSKNYNMYCNFIDGTTDVRGSVSKRLAQYEGESFKVILAGFGFYDTFPTNTYCPDGENPWANYNVFYNGELVYSEGTIPMKIWNEVLTAGYFDLYAQYGLTYEITSTFCSSQNLSPV
ncbi:MAG: hypothetical protein ABI986_07975 [Chloroflexota bacterium]